MHTDLYHVVLVYSKTLRERNTYTFCCHTLAGCRAGLEKVLDHTDPDIEPLLDVFNQALVRRDGLGSLGVAVGQSKFLNVGKIALFP